MHNVKMFFQDAMYVHISNSSSCSTFLLPTRLISPFLQGFNFLELMPDVFRFEAPAAARARSASEGNSARGEDVIPIYRKRDLDPFAQHESQASQSRTHTQKTYFVVDGVDALQKFGADAWDRVVAVLTTGQAWQFKQYKYNEPKSLFHHGKNFYTNQSTLISTSPYISERLLCELGQ